MHGFANINYKNDFIKTSSGHVPTQVCSVLLADPHCEAGFFSDWLSCIMHRGYIKLWRKSWDHPFYHENRPATKREAWEDILAMANHKDEKVLVGNKVIQCGRGQSVKSLDSWGRLWNWSRHKVRDFLLICKDLNQITYENLTVTVRVTVCNYQIYNDQPNRQGTDKERIGNGQGTDRDTNKNVKNDKNDKKNTYGQFKHVKITKDEHDRLVADFGGPIVADAIRILDEYMETSGKRYKNHNLVLRKWPVERAKQENGGDSETRQYVAPYHREFEDE